MSEKIIAITQAGSFASIASRDFPEFEEADIFRKAISLTEHDYKYLLALMYQKDPAYKTEFCRVLGLTLNTN